MTFKRYTEEFRDEAVRQVTERGYSVGEVAERLGVSSKSLYKWIRDADKKRPDSVIEKRLLYAINEIDLE